MTMDVIPFHFGTREVRTLKIEGEPTGSDGAADQRLEFC